jgi:hypothetical protein
VNGPLDWQRWLTKHAEAWKLSEGEARVLNVLAAHVNREGVVTMSHLTEAEIGRRTARNGVPRSPRTIRRILAELRRKGLVTSRQRGPQTACEYQLHEVYPSEQTALHFDALDRSQDRPKVAARQTGRPATSLTESPATQGGLQEREKRTTEEEDAREQIPSVTGLASTLSRVVEVLGTAPGLLVDELSVNAILQGHPERDGYDHERAAWTVTSWAHEGGLSMSSAPRLLQRALLKQQPQPAEHASGRQRREPAAAGTGGRDFSRFKRSAGW